MAEISAQPELELNLMGKIPDGFDLGYIKRLVKSINDLAPEWLVGGHINVKLVDDAQIQALNKEYSGNDYPTDVLSFSYIETGEKPIEDEIGDIAISFETAQKQAHVAGTKLEDEVATLCLHGILHIFGFDHAEAIDQITMDKLQQQILSTADITYRDFGWKNEHGKA